MPKFDIIFVLPYLFSDHPSFPEGILKRVLEAEGFRVGVIRQPFWQKAESFSILGAPTLFFAIIPGPVDSVVLNYTASRKRRREDLYQQNGEAFFPGYPPSIQYKIRPDLTVVVFANRIREAFKGIPIVIGGIEASLRCFAHYDFQKDKIKRSILLDSRADILVTGMGEKQLTEIARRAKNGESIKEMDIAGTSVYRKDAGQYPGYTLLPSLEEIEKEPVKLMEAALKFESGHIKGTGIIQPQRDGFIVQHPDPHYTPKDIDGFYGYQYTRTHMDGTVRTPALRMNLFSVTSHRGCGGGCAFCSISQHEGKRIISRSFSSIIKEIETFKKHPEWRGVVSDIGGASAELYGMDCKNEACPRVSCFLKSICPVIRSTSPFLELLREARKVTGVKNVFLGSGIRYDLVLRNPELLEEIMAFHSGRFLRVAPEHTEEGVLDLMRKSRFELFERFVELFNRINDRLKRKIQLAPYLIVGHPGETMKDVIKMGQRLMWEMQRVKQ